MSGLDKAVCVELEQACTRGPDSEHRKKTRHRLPTIDDDGDKFQYAPQVALARFALESRQAIKS